MSTTITIQPYHRDNSFSFIDFLQRILPELGINDIDVLFGFAWGIEVFDYKTRTISIASLKREIDDVELQGHGEIGRDDLYISINAHDLEILLCHEADIHFTFETLTPLVNQIIEYLLDSFQDVTLGEHYYPEQIYPYGLPAFLFHYEVINESKISKKVVLESWQEMLECPAGETLTVTGYSSSPGLLEIEQDENTITIKGWPSSQIRVHRDKDIILDTKTLDSKGFLGKLLSAIKPR